MKCELCQKAEAETAIHKRLNGEDQELYVCGACAREAARPAPARPSPAPPEVSLPLMSMILDAAFEIAGRALNTSEPACPVCGITRTEYRKASLLGCPACYEAFAKELEGAIQELHRSLQHVGKVPERYRLARRLRQLHADMEAAVKGQRYEEASALWEQIKRLGGADAAAEGEAAC